MGILTQFFSGRQSERNKEVDRLYNLYKEPFVRFASKYYPIDETTALDIYQESFMALYLNVRDGKYKESQVSLKTYLFEIGKHQICKHLSKNRVEVVDIQLLSSEWVEQNYDAEDWAEAQEIVRRLISEADDICNKVLTLYYWEKIKMEEIARRMNYKTEQVAKNKKRSCLRRLEFELKKRLEASDIHWKDKKQE